MKGAVGRVKVKRTSVNSEQEMVEGLARAVQPTPPVKRMGKSRAASSVLINTTRCCVLTLIHISKLTCCQLPVPSGLNWVPSLLCQLLVDHRLLLRMNSSCLAHQVGGV